MLHGRGPCDRRSVLKLLMGLMSKHEGLCLTMLAIGAVQSGNGRRRGRK